jgi:hypothetical protein
MISLKFKDLLYALLVSTIIIFMLHISETNAASFQGSRNGSGMHTAWYDSSIASYGYTSHFDAARSYWNYSSSNVYISKNSGTHKKYQDRYYVGNTEVKNLIGLAAFYQYTWYSSKSVEADEYWDYCEIIIYENNMRSSSNYSDSSVKMNIAHEIGHTLKLAHAPTYYGVPYYESVMNTGFFPIYSPTTDYDIQSLTNKWGY